jgi:hypothetical protein
MTHDFLQARAKKLGLCITADADNDDGLDQGPFLLRCGQTGYLIWAHGLSAEGIADALNCYERELQSVDDDDNRPPHGPTLARDGENG